MTPRRLARSKMVGRVRARRGLVPTAVESLESRTLLASGSLGTFLATVPTGPVTLAAQPAASSSPAGISPAQFRQAYAFNAIRFGNGLTADGTGQTIAIVDAYNQPDIKSDLHNFDLQYGLADPPSIRVVAQDGSGNLPANATEGDWGYEISLDVEWAHAMAPGANILLVEAASASDDLNTAVEWAAAQPGVSVVSMSWGSPEYAGEQADDPDYTTPAGHPGVTFLAATGDSGSPGDYPAASPNVLAVGGTRFTTGLDPQGDYATEAGWSSGGGGISPYEARPGYQAGVVTQSTSARTTPDVALDAGTGVAIYDSYDAPTSDWLDMGGTSLATPVWGALIAIADQGLAAIGKGPLGGQAAMSGLYALDTKAGSISFHDITTGSNGSSAGTGYDLVTGVGTPVAAAVAEGLSGNIAAPTGIGPSGMLSADPTFQWSPILGATSYHLVAYNQATSARVLDVVVTGSTSYTAGPGVFAPGQAYAWQVASQTALSATGPAGAALGFVMPTAGVPSPQSPSNDSSVNTTTPTLQWSAVPGASGYALTIVDTANPTQPVANQLLVAGTSYTVPTALPYGHNYVWSVQAVLGPGTYGAASAFSAFNVAPLAAPSPSAPASGASLATASVTFQWSSVIGAAGYLLTLTDVTAGSAPATIGGISGTSYTVTAPLLSGHTYRWSVSADDVWGDVGAASTIGSFTVVLPPAAVTAPSPSSPSGKVSTTFPALHWSTVAGAASYGIQIVDQTGGAHTSVVALAKVVGTTYVPNFPLVAGHTYSWQVLAYGASGAASGWSTSLQFTVKDEAANDFDGTGISEITVYTPGIALWTIVNPSNWSVRTTILGAPNGQTIPVPADYDGIGRAEMAYYSPSNATWTIFNPITNTFRTVVFGSPGQQTIPIPGDYDGIGRAEPAYYVPATATWTVFNPSTNTTRSAVWGVPNYWDVPIPGDYDGIGRTEMAAYAPSIATWYVWNPLTNTVRSAVWGLPNYWDIPASGDYDGIGHTEMAAFVPSTATWYVWNPNTNAVRTFVAGATGLHDIPLSSPLGSFAALGMMGRPTTTSAAPAVTPAAVHAEPAAVVTTAAEPAAPSPTAAPAVLAPWKTVGQSVPQGYRSLSRWTSS